MLDKLNGKKRRILQYEYKNWKSNQILPGDIKLDKLITMYDEYGAPFCEQEIRQLLQSLLDFSQSLNDEYNEIATKHSHHHRPITVLTR